MSAEGDIKARLAEVKTRIARAAEAAGRNPDSVRLVAVSKRKPAAAIREAYAAGHRDFGENYVQEMMAKAAELADLADLRFHMIGHLQRNKVRQVLEVATVVHTVDSMKLAAELGRRAASEPVPVLRRFPIAGAAIDDRLPVFIEVNVGGEAQKSGCAPGELRDIAGAIASHPALRLAGLMTVPPHTEDPAGALPFFRALARLRDEHGGVETLPELSMGMTHDLEQAIAAGSTIVRIGTAIFGERS